MKQYIPKDHTPFANSAAALYADAYEDLLKPTPSTKFRDYPKLNTMTGGLRPLEFTILCGATGTGKTTLCANISRDLIYQSVPHFVASVETGHLDFVKRVMSSMIGRDWNTGDPITIADAKEFHTKYGTHFESDALHLSLYDNRIPVEKLMADIAWMVEHKGIKVAIIDNLNFFLEITKSSEQIIEMDRVIHELIIFCKHIPVHIIMVMHPKKTESGRIESENDIKGSSSANQESHNILLFNRPHPDLIKSGAACEMDREILIAKMRRKGRYVRRRLILNSVNGVLYNEAELY